MDDQITEQLNDEVTRGRQAERVFIDFVEPFLKAKRELLFQAFNDLPITATEDLAEVKRMGQTINAFEQEFKNFIDTGKMAAVAISELMPKDEDKH